MRGMSEKKHVFREDCRFPGRDANPEPPNNEAVPWMNRVLICGRGKRFVLFFETPVPVLLSSQASLKWLPGCLFPMGKANGTRSFLRPSSFEVKNRRSSIFIRLHAFMVCTCHEGPEVV